MTALFDIGGDTDYATRVEALLRSRLAVWDVLKSGERTGSLDSNIATLSAVPNDIAGFLTAHPNIAHVFFNGAAAEALFKRYRPPNTALNSIQTFQRLPSTSPANTVSFTVKMEAWSAVEARTFLRDARTAEGRGNHTA